MPEEFVPRYESFVDRQIREATERGEFDDLPGAGKPLRMRYEGDPAWWIRQKMDDEGIRGALPTPLALRREKELIQATLADVRDVSAARDIVEDLNERITASNLSPAKPRIITGLLDVNAVLAVWRSRRSA